MSIENLASGVELDMANRTLVAAKPRAASTSKTKRSTAAAKTRNSSSTDKMQVRIFVSYSHKDSGARQQLDIHLAVLKRDNVSTWFDGDLNAGDELDPNIGLELKKANIFVALFSPEYLNSRYCWELEYNKAMIRRARGTMHVVVVVVRPCDWKSTAAARFKLLPRDGRAVTKWGSTDEAFLDVVGGLRSVVAAFRKEQATTTKTPVKRLPAPKEKVAPKRRVTVATVSKKVTRPKTTPKTKPPPRKTR